MTTFDRLALIAMLSLIADKVGVEWRTIIGILVAIGLVCWLAQAQGRSL